MDWTAESVMQESLRAEYEKMGGIAFASDIEPQIGEIRVCFGMAMRVVRHLTLEEFRRWGAAILDTHDVDEVAACRPYHFIVEPAD